MVSPCPECGAPLADGRTCADDFHQLLFWENERPALGEVHHLLVLCYHLQHPSLYSAEGLAHARQLLAEFVSGNLSPQEARRQQRTAVASGSREWSVTAREGNHGHYARRPEWSMTASDVVAGGINNYAANVWAWASNVHRALTRTTASGSG